MKKCINQYFDELIYRIKKGNYEEKYISLIADKTDYIMLPIMMLKVQRVDLHLNKLIIDLESLIQYRETIIDNRLLDNFKFIIVNYNQLNGIVLPAMNRVKSVATYTPNLTVYQLLTYVLNMLNQLRGNIVFRDDNLIKTRLKHEYQVIAFFLYDMFQQNLKLHRLIFQI